LAGICKNILQSFSRVGLPYLQKRKRKEHVAGAINIVTIIKGTLQIEGYLYDRKPHL
jgi:hypothetical protein